MASNGAQQVKDLYLKALRRDDKPTADTIAQVSRMLGGPALSPTMDASESSTVGISDADAYAEYQRLSGIGQGDAETAQQQPTEDEELESVMNSLGRRG